MCEFIHSQLLTSESDLRSCVALSLALIGFVILGTIDVVAHKHVDTTLYERRADAPGKSRVHSAYDLDLQRSAVSRLAVELCDSRLRVFLVLVGEADDRVWGTRLEGGSGYWTTPFEDGLGGGWDGVQRVFECREG